MSNFPPLIILTTPVGKLSAKVYVNPLQIAYIEALPKDSARQGCFIHFTGNAIALFVEESPETILALPS